jgi:hypothetical protein
MELVTKPWDIDLDKIGYKDIRLWYGIEDENTPPQMGRYLAEWLPEAVYKENPGKKHYSIGNEEVRGEFLKDLPEAS